MNKCFKYKSILLQSLKGELSFFCTEMDNIWKEKTKTDNEIAEEQPGEETVWFYIRFVNSNSKLCVLKHVLNSFAPQNIHFECQPSFNRYS